MCSATVSSPVRAHPSDPAVAASAPQYDPQIGDALKALVGQYGDTLLAEPGRLRGLLQDECPGARREISVLLQALDERVPQDLLRVQSGEPIGSLGPRLARRLGEETSMSSAASHWAVQTWARGLGLEGLGVAPQAARDVPTESSWIDGGLPPQVQHGAGGAAGLPEGDTAPPLPPPPRRRLWPVLVGGAVAAAAAFGLWSVFVQQKLEITAVDATTPLVGNGKPVSVQLGYATRNAAPRSIEVRFVRGDGNWKPEPTLVRTADAPDSDAGRVGAGSFSMRVTRPSSVTFAYTLVAADGRRSAPFERTFAVAPPVAITDIGVPRGLVVGQGFDLAFKYARGASDIVKIERRVVQTTGSWGNMEATQPVKYSDAAGGFNYHFDPFTQAMSSTLEFTLIDAEGLRSEPYRVVLNVAAAAPAPVRSVPSAAPGLPPGWRGLLGTVIGVRELREPGQASGAGAVVAGILGGLAGRQAGQGRGRDVMTGVGALGGALAGNEIEKHLRGGSVWETTVRMDDGNTRTVRQASAPGWRPGSRVRVEGNAVALL